MTSTTTDRRFGVNGNLAFKAPVRVATTANITLSGLQTIDGVALAADDRVLVKNQTTGSENGIYDVSTGSWTRSVDANGNRDLVKGTIVLVTEGTSQGHEFFEITSSNPITVGTTSITWAVSLTASMSSLSFLASGTGAVARSAQNKMRDVVTFADFGADMTGVADSSTAVQNAINSGARVVGGNGTVKINSSITLPSNCWLDIGGTKITANTGATSLFKGLNGAAGICILGGGGGIISGTCSEAFFFEGVTNTPAVQADYANVINIIGVQVSSTTITRALTLSKAVKSLNVYGCNFFTQNGVDASGKCVEVNFTDSIIYSATGAAGTRGVKLRSTGGTTTYNEGWYFNHCTIDNFEIAHDVTDIFDYQVAGGHVGSIAGGYAFSFQAPSTNLCQNIGIGGNLTISTGSIRFVGSGSGIAYHADFNGFQMIGVSGTHIDIGNNAADISVRNFRFLGSTSGNGVVGSSNNNPRIVVDGGSMDSTFVSGVQLKGASGSGCVVANLAYYGTGDAVYVERSVVIRNVPVTTTTVASYRTTYNSTDLAGNFAVGATIATLPLNFAKGERGYVDVSISASSMAVGTQRLDVGVPSSNFIMPSGSGWSAQYLYPASSAALVTARIPYYCAADTSGNLTLANSTNGNTVAVASHSRFGIVREW